MLVKLLPVVSRLSVAVLQNEVLADIKGIDHPKMIMMSLMTHPEVVPNP